MTLLEIVERERRGIAQRLGVASGGWVLAAASAVMVAGALALGGSRWLTLPRGLPFVVWGLVVLVGAALFRRLSSRVKKEASLPALAHTVERERSLRAGSLRGTLEVWETGVLGRLGAEQLTQKLHGMGKGTLVPQYRQRVMRRVLLASGGALLGALGVVSAAIAAPDGLRAMLHPAAAWSGTLLGALSLGDVPGSVLRGERISVTVRAPGRKTITVSQRVTGSSWRSAAVAIGGDSAVLALGPLDADVALVATDGRSTSDTAVIKVVDKPFVGDVSVKAQFPAYLGRREESVPLGELVRIPRGTVLEFAGQSSTELSQVGLLRGESAALSMSVDGRRFTGRMVASASGRYDWRATGRTGAIADLPPALDLDVLPDSAPRVEIVTPSRDSTVNSKDTVNVSVLATDDHGIGSVMLKIALVNSRGEVRTSRTHALGGGAAQDQFAGDLGLSMAPLQPGDAMKITAIATDASPWRQVGSSRELVLRLPSASDQRDAARAAADSAVAKALAAANAQRQLNQRTQDAARAQAREAEKKGKDAPMSFEASEQAKRFAKEQRDLADRMQQVQNAAKQLEKQLKDAGALDSTLQNRLREAQRLMREALTPELAEKLRKLEEASKDLSPEESRKALQDLAEQQKQLRDMLDKSVEMLKRAALEGQMETLKDEAKDLAKRQRDLVDSLRKADQQQEKSAAQKMAQELSEKAKDLQKDVDALQKRLQQEKAEAGAERVKEAGEKIDESMQKLQDALQQKGQQQEGQQGEKQPGQQGAQGEQKNQQGQQGQQGQQQAGQEGKGGQQAQNKTGPGNQGNQQGQQSGSEAAEKAAQAMEQAANELSKARDQQVGEWKKELSGELDRSVQEMLQLAREQDQLEQQARKGASPNDLRSQQSALQQGVDKAMQRLQDAGNKSSLLSQRTMRMMSDAKRKVEEATRQTMQSTNGQQIASSMRESSEGLNQAAASLVRDRERTNNSQSSTGFAELMEQLQQMAKQQNGINSAMQQLMPQQQSKDGQSQARELAKEQREVAAKLEESGEKDASGRAEEMAREARQIAQQLESGQLDPAVLERQQRLFRKMLDAGRLLEEEEREDTGKREAKPWTGTEVYTPAGANASGKSASRFTPPTWNDLRGLTPEERRLVLEYFKRINGKP